MSIQDNTTRNSDALQSQAVHIMTHMKNGYVLADDGSLNRAIARPKLKTAKKGGTDTSALSRAVMYINLCVSCPAVFTLFYSTLQWTDLIKYS